MMETAFGSDIISYLNDDSVIEVMLNPDGKIWIESFSKGKIFSGIELDEKQSENIIKLIASFKGSVADSISPEVSLQIPIGGARFQGWLPPIVSKPTFAIRKRITRALSLDDYLNDNIINKYHYDFLIKSVNSRKNIIVSGGTGSGKTTFCNALLSQLKGTTDRILVLEDLPELQIDAPDIVNMETSTQISMHDLVRGSLRMRPDRIVIGEVRDGIALDMLKAWNTGHPGGVCTVHANGAIATLHRIEDLVLESVINVPRSLILEAIDVVVYLERSKDGSRKVKEVVYVTGYDDVNKKYLVEHV